MSQLFTIIGNAALAYGASLAPNPIMKVRFMVEPTPSDVGLSEWQISLALECYGEIVEGKPKLLESVLWEGHGEDMSGALVDLHLQVQASVVKRVIALKDVLEVLGPFIASMEQDADMAAAKTVDDHDPANVGIDNGKPDRVVSMSAVLHPR
jgi:hypothetical protein